MRRHADPAWIFLAGTAVRAAATQAKWVVLTVRLVDDLRLEPHELALLGTALELSVLAGEIPTGVVADVISRRLSIILSFLIMGPTMALAGVFETFWLIALTQIGWGLGWTLQSGADVAWVTDELQDQARVDRLLVTRAKVEVVAHAAGVPLGVGLAALTTRSTAIVAASMALFVWGAMLIAIMPERNFHRTPGTAGAEFRRVLAIGGRMTMRTPSLRILAVTTLLAGFASEALDRLDVARLVEVGIPDDLDEVLLVGLAMFARALVGIGVVQLVERGMVGIHAARLLMMLYAAAAICVTIAAGVSVLGVVVVALVLQSGIRSGDDALIAIIANDHQESDARATVLSFISQSHAAGEIAGGIALGALATATSISTAFAVAAVTFLAAGLVSARAGRAGPPAGAAPATAG